MKSLISAFALVLACAIPPAMADDKVDGSGLTAEQTAKAQLYIESLKKQEATGVSASVRNEVSAWTDLGANLGKGIVAAAKEVGTAASDFAVTPLGKVVTFVLVFKLVGKAALGLVIGIALFVLGVCTAYKLWNGATKYDRKWEIHPRVNGWPIFGHYKVLVEETRSHTDGDEQLAAIICFVASLGAATWCILGTV